MCGAFLSLIAGATPLVYFDSPSPSCFGSTVHDTPVTIESAVPPAAFDVARTSLRSASTASTSRDISLRICSCSLGGEEERMTLWAHA